MFKIGIDLGYGFVKAIAETNRTMLFPSVVAKGAKRSFGGLFGGESKDYEVIVNGERYYVGELALTQKADATRAFDEERHAHFSTPVLVGTVLAVLAPANQPVHVATGLPLRYYGEHGEKFAETLRRMNFTVEMPGIYQGARRVAVGDVTLFPQAASALYAEILNEKGELKNAEMVTRGGLLGVVDVGYKTTDFMLVDMDGPEVLEDFSDTLGMGMSDVYKAVQGVVRDETGESIDILQVENYALKGEMWFMGRRHDLRGIVRDAGMSLAQSIVDRLNLSWRDKKKFLRRLYVAGGGAMLVGPYLDTGDCPVEVVAAPQFANARGYLAVAAKKERPFAAVG